MPSSLALTVYRRLNYSNEGPAWLIDFGAASQPLAMSERESSVSLARGLFILRYVRAGASGAAPVVFVRPADESGHDVEIITAPGDQPGVIEAPGGCLVIRAERSGVLHVVVRSLGGINAEAELRLESIGAGRVATSDLPADVGPAGRAGRGRVERLPRLEVAGHVSRRGDVHSSSGEWIAGPGAPAPIEGIALSVSGNSDVAVEYQALLGGSWTPWTSGAYAGTRGKFQALHGIRLRLIGPGATEFLLDAQALFLGAATSSRKGREIEFVSEAQADPLVGLKVALIIDQSRAQSIEASDARPFGSSERQQAGRVRVFRASNTRS